MPDQAYVRNRPSPHGVRQLVAERLVRTWTHSPRVNGKLRLQANPYTYDRSGIIAASTTSWGLDLQLPADAWWNTTRYPGSDYNSAFNGALSKLRGKLYKGGASLGVTLGSYKQSRDMIVDRYRDLDQRATALFAEKLRNPKGWARRGAGAHLEVIFGWKPLLVDIHAACTSVIQLADTYGNISAGKSVRSESINKTENPYLLDIDQVNGTIRVRFSGAYRVANPNAWLAERAGLINPAAVAWDLVPWSFLVGMFVNIGALVNSITDYMGLSFINFCQSDTYEGIGRRYVRRNNGSLQKPVYEILEAHAVRKQKSRRVIGGPPTPRLQFRVPEANWETAAMAASLFTQKFAGGLYGLSKKARSVYTD